MDIRERHIGGICRRPRDGKPGVTVDVGALVRRLLLFEHCTLESVSLQEVPAFVRTFGMNGFEALLESDAFSIICDTVTVGLQDNLPGPPEEGNRDLPPGSCRLTALSMVPPEHPEWADVLRDAYIWARWNEVGNISDLSSRQQATLKRKLNPLLGAYPQSIITNSQTGIGKIISGGILPVQRALANAYRTMTGNDLRDQIEVRAENLENDQFKISTDLTNHTDLTQSQVNSILRHALFGIAGVELRLQVMRAFDSLSGFQEDEIDVFQDRVNFLTAQLDPDAHERRFGRVAAIGGVPGLDDLPASQQVNMKRLLKLRDSDECRDFRAWLRQVDSQSDEEINNNFFSTRERLAEITHTRTATVIRFIIGSGIGAIPGLGGLVAGPAEALADRFIIDKLIGRPGPVSFLGRDYESLFRDLPRGS